MVSRTSGGLAVCTDPDTDPGCDAGKFRLAPVAEGSGAEFDESDIEETEGREQPEGC